MMFWYAYKLSNFLITGHPDLLYTCVLFSRWNYTAEKSYFEKETLTPVVQ